VLQKKDTSHHEIFGVTRGEKLTANPLKVTQQSDLQNEETGHGSNWVHNTFLLVNSQAVTEGKVEIKPK
jgi:hypothetical protein